MKEYTGKERLAAALKGKYADGIPVSVIAGAVCAKLAGYTVREYITDVSKNIKSVLTFYEKFKPDTIAALLSQI